MDAYEAIVRAITNDLGVQFRPASVEGLAALKALNVSERVMDFYRRYEPVNCGRGQIRFWAIEDMVIENTQGVPGIGIHPHGYVVFASTFTGNAYCFNFNRLNSAGDPEVVLASHETIDEDCTAEEAHKSVKRVASSLEEFLDQFHRSDVDEAVI